MKEQAKVGKLKGKLNIFQVVHLIALYGERIEIRYVSDEFVITF